MQHVFEIGDRKGNKEPMCKCETWALTIPPGATEVLTSPSVTIRDQQRIIVVGLLEEEASWLILDCLKGVHVSVSRSGRAGVVLEREFKKGSVPKKEKWSQYNVESKNLGKDRFTARQVLEKSTISYYEKSAKKRGNVRMAYQLYQHYVLVGDDRKRKRWATTIREMVDDSSGDPEAQTYLRKVETSELRMGAEG